MDVRSWWKSACAIACLFVGVGSAQAQQVINCGSVNGQWTSCPTNWPNAQLLRQESRSSCERGISWGFDRGEVWVDRGCRGLFQAARGYSRYDRYDRYEPPPRSLGWRREGQGGFQGGNQPHPGGFGGGGGSFGRPAGRARQVQCGSVNKAYRFCPADIGPHQQVVLEINQSDKRCQWARDWGVQDAGIWVSNGCRAVFSIR